MTRAVKIFACVVICGLFAVSVYAGVIAQQQATADPAAAQPTASNQFAILITTIAGFASLLATHLFQFYKENRNRKWDLQDRASAREEMLRHQKAQRVETLQTAVEIARVSNINRDHLLGAIDRKTELTAEAGAKTDDFNSRLEALHQELAELSKKLPPEVPKEA